MPLKKKGFFNTSSRSIYLKAIRYNFIKERLSLLTLQISLG